MKKPDAVFRDRPVDILNAFPVAGVMVVAVAAFLDDGTPLTEDEMSELAVECAVDVVRVWEDYCMACAEYSRDADDWQRLG